MKKIHLLFMMIVSALSFGQDGLTNYGLNAGIGGNNSSYFGKDAGGLSTAHFNTFIGSGSGYKNNADYGTFVGVYAGFNNQTGSNNSFFGHYAGYYNNSGEKNVFIGGYSGYGNWSGQKNVFVGYKSGYQNSTGIKNVFIGYKSANSNIKGKDNVFIGHQSGYSTTEGKDNVFIGNGAGYKSKGTGNVFLGFNAGYNEVWANDKLYISNSSTSTPLIYGEFGTKQLGINTTNIPNGFAFAVKGKVITEEVKVALEGTPGVWPDYVFYKDYKLPTLKEVENYIKQKGHLQNIPSAKEVKENGIFLGDMNAKLLQKIEELTLYTIRQQKELEAEKKKNTNFEKRLSHLEKLL